MFTHTGCLRFKYVKCIPSKQVVTGTQCVLDLVVLVEINNVASILQCNVKGFKLNHRVEVNVYRKSITTAD